MEVFAPIPIARDKTAIRVNHGFFAKERRANRMSIHVFIGMCSSERHASTASRRQPFWVRTRRATLNEGVRRFARVCIPWREPRELVARSFRIPFGVVQ